MKIKTFLTYIIILLITPLALLSQRYTYKFYKEGDSAKFANLQQISQKAFYYYADSNKVVFDKEKAKITREEYQRQLKDIKRYPYLKYFADAEYTPLSEALKSDQKDTIQSISMYGLAYHKIPLKILQFKNLQKLEIVHTKIDKLPWLINFPFIGLNKLTYLRILNQRNKQPFRFKWNKHIQYLSYRENPEAPLPKNMHRLKALVELDLVRNDFTEQTPLRLDKYKNVQEVNLRSNHINIDRLTKKEASSVTKLILSRNEISRIPESIKKFPNLIELQLAENNIKSEDISEELGQLKDLELLSFYKNDLSHIPAFLFNLQNLKELDLYYNQLEEIPTEIKYLQNLTKLYLANNRIYKIPDELGSLTNLQQLYLKHNRISYLPNSLSDLKNITDFHINNNYIQGFPSCILVYDKLQDLDISFNEIHSLPPELLELNHLKLLWMRGITFEARSKEEAIIIKNTIESLQKKGVKVSIEID